MQHSEAPHSRGVFPVWYTVGMIDEKILSRGLQDLNKNTGYQCKGWIQHVVHDVTGFWIPNTTEERYAWDMTTHRPVDGKTIRMVYQKKKDDKDDFDFTSLKSLHVVQLRWAEGIYMGNTFRGHTMFWKTVKDDGTIAVFDCNFRNDLVARERTDTIDNFISKTESYTIYKIVDEKEVQSTPKKKDPKNKGKRIASIHEANRQAFGWDY